MPDAQTSQGEVAKEKVNGVFHWFNGSGESSKSVPAESPDKAEFEALRKAEKAGVKIVVAPQLFPTPAHIAREMAIELDISDQGQSYIVLEPSAGTGRLIDAVVFENPSVLITAIEINGERCKALKGDQRITHVFQDDFMQARLGSFDRIIMKPPFGNGADIRHIKRAIDLLSPGGRLVAICANGPRQQAELKPLCREWSPLPGGTFIQSGTNVNTAMLVIDK